MKLLNMIIINLTIINIILIYLGNIKEILNLLLNGYQKKIEIII